MIRRGERPQEAPQVFSTYGKQKAFYGRDLNRDSTLFQESTRYRPISAPVGPGKASEDPQVCPQVFGSYVQIGIFAREHAAGCFSALLLIGEAPLKVYVRREQRAWPITPYPRDGRYFAPERADRSIRGWV